MKETDLRLLQTSKLDILSAVDAFLSCSKFNLWSNALDFSSGYRLIIQFI